MLIATVRSRMRNDLKWLGSFAGESGEDRLDSAILSSIQKIYNKRPREWMLSTHSLSASDANTGPYDPPSDFRGFAPEKLVNRMGWGDIQASYIIKDSTTMSWDIYYNEIDGKFYFRNNPGANTLTVAYLPTFDIAIGNVATILTACPNAYYTVLESWVPAHILNTPANKRDSQAYYAEGVVALQEVWDSEDRSLTKSKVRSPRGFNGCDYENIAQQEPQNPNTNLRRNFSV